MTVLRTPLTAILTIREVSGRPVTSRVKPVLLTAFDRDALVFATNLRFPVSTDYLLSLELSYRSRTVRIAGRVVQQMPDGNWFAHRLQLEPGCAEDPGLAYVINKNLAMLDPELSRRYRLYGAAAALRPG